MEKSSFDENRFLKKMLEESALEPGNDFLSKVTQRIKKKNPLPEYLYKPVISFKAWILMSFGFVLLIAFVVSQAPETKAGPLNEYLTPVFSAVQNLQLPLSVNPFVAVILFSISLLLLLDFYIKQKQKG
jgi:hypothetical protein